jgi:glycosyl-4,4'-diaponeurosporenoate acyltransferase
MYFLKCFVYLFACGVISFLLGRLVPHKWVHEERFPFAMHGFEEDGSFYEHFGIRHWQKRVPDMSRIFPQLIPKKVLEGEMTEKLPILIKETCIAELTHVLLSLVALLCLNIWSGLGGVIVTILFELGNLPYILIQRYNRPRLKKLYRALCQRDQRENEEKQAIEG